MLWLRIKWYHIMEKLFRSSSDDGFEDISFRMSWRAKGFSFMLMASSLLSIRSDFIFVSEPSVIWLKIDLHSSISSSIIFPSILYLTFLINTFIINQHTPLKQPPTSPIQTQPFPINPIQPRTQIQPQTQSKLTLSKFQINFKWQTHSTSSQAKARAPWWATGKKSESCES